ncbi:MAG: RNase adapter RapZ [Candidatus Nanopelagicales bacterium]|nr:RNase adapter RapZ [Candidatus Nanopelagicales bacterium]
MSQGSQRRELVLVTGMSGAGKSTAARALEDLGWFVIDNLPLRLLPAALEQVPVDRNSVGLAVVVDARGGDAFADLDVVLARIRAEGANARVIFIEASDESLVRRFESSRRPHPLQGRGRILDGVELERSLLQRFRGDADLVIDTTNLNIHELRRRVEAAFPDETAVSLRATVISFGFKFGIPVDADVVLDVRFLPNPYWDPLLRNMTGLEAEVNDQVVASADAREFLDIVTRMVTLVTDGYLREGKRYMTVAVGCTGGKHRSVAMAENLSVRLVKRGVETLVTHRDLGRE